MSQSTSQVDWPNLSHPNFFYLQYAINWAITVKEISTYMPFYCLTEFFVPITPYPEDTCLSVFAKIGQHH